MSQSQEEFCEDTVICVAKPLLNDSVVNGKYVSKTKNTCVCKPLEHDSVICPCRCRHFPKTYETNRLTCCRERCRGAKCVRRGRGGSPHRRSRRGSTLTCSRSIPESRLCYSGY